MNSKILIIDDDAHIAEVTKKLLELLAYEVETITIPSMLLIEKTITARPPHLILMDINLKGCELDGIELAKQIKKFDVPIVYFSGSADAGLLKRAQETNPIGYITKPYSELELKATVEMALYRSIAETERARMEKALKRRLEIEKIVSTISSRFIGTPDVNDAIQSSLAELGGLKKSSRAYLYLFSEDGTLMTMTHEWCREGMHPQKESFKDIPVRTFSEWIKKLLHGQFIHIKSLSDRPEMGDIKKELFEESHTINSMLLYPLFLENRLSGFMGFESIEKDVEWLDDDVEFLKVASDVIGRGIEHNRSVEKLNASRASFSNIVEKSTDGIIVVNTGGIVRFVNSTARIFLSHRTDALIDNTFDIPLSHGMVIETEIMRPNGDCGIGETRAVETRWEDGSAYLVLIRDITDRRHAEEQLRHSQKMEAIGRLAGGVAHDFNNLLTGIKGYAELALLNMEETEPLYGDLMEIHNAAVRAAELTRQLLIFSRKQPMAFNPVDLNEVIGKSLKMIRRIIGENIAVDFVQKHDLWTVNADETSIDQILMNLVVNAADAMPQGGKLSIGTENVTFEEGVSIFMPGGRPGRFACISVSDTGTGMDREILQNIFEPFFTTKEAGKGTGLGLSVVYGLVAQHEGWIHVTSCAGQGSTFNTYFPVIEAPKKTKKEMMCPQECLSPSERVLLVEDEESVRRFVTKVLEKQGYVVLTASRTDEAMEIFGREHGAFDLIFSDVVLPDKSGIELIDGLLALKPGLRVLLSSGYADDRSQLSIIRERGFPFIQKPYSVSDLLEIVSRTIKATVP